VLLAMVDIAAGHGHRHVERLVWRARPTCGATEGWRTGSPPTEAARAGGDQDGQIRALCSLARVLTRIGRFEEGIDALARIEPLLWADTATATRISVRLSYARVLGLCGRFAEALTHARAARALTPGRGDADAAGRHPQRDGQAAVERTRLRRTDARRGD
jgi:hypothetical protein